MKIFNIKYITCVFNFDIEHILSLQEMVGSSKEAVRRR